jgi:hypothetical protein
MKKISERNEHVKLEKGYCVICGQYGQLKKDHVPPQCALKPTALLQKTITEYFSSKDIPPIKARNGTVFKTICYDCNSKVLGSMDAEIGRVTSEFTKQLIKYFNGHMFYGNNIAIKFDAIKFLRAMTGHVLAATSVKECLTPIADSPFYTPLRDFVLGKDINISETHNFHYWFYPLKRQVTAQTVGFYNNGYFSICSCVHFYPIAFQITLKSQSTAPSHAYELKPTDEYLHFNMSTHNIDYVTFPFINLKGNQLSLITSGLTCVSYPK